MSERAALPSLRATRALAHRLALSLVGRDLILLEGDLGTGKTTFTRYLAQALSIDPGWVSSPSFTLVQRYPAPAGGAALVHVDLYRLAGEGELPALGLEEILGSGDVVVVEWPRVGERLFARSGRPLWRLRFSESEGVRLAEVEGPRSLTPGRPRRDDRPRSSPPPRRRR